MNLIEGELIEQIEQIDEGWWSGVGQGGEKTGLFPGENCFFVCFGSTHHVVLTTYSELCGDFGGS